MTPVMTGTEKQQITSVLFSTEAFPRLSHVYIAVFIHLNAHFMLRKLNFV